MNRPRMQRWLFTYFLVYLRLLVNHVRVKTVRAINMTGLNLPLFHWTLVLSLFIIHLVNSRSFIESIYRRGARRWRKVYRVNGHTFQPKRFNRRAFCIYCSDRIWGLGRQGFKCISCKLMVHKKCHKLIQTSCFVQPVSGSFSDHQLTPH